MSQPPPAPTSLPLPLLQLHYQHQVVQHLHSLWRQYMMLPLKAEEARPGEEGHLSPRAQPSYNGSGRGSHRAGWPPHPRHPRGPDSAPDSFVQRTFLWPQGGGHPGPRPQGSWATRDAHLPDCKGTPAPQPSEML